MKYLIAFLLLPISAYADETPLCNASILHNRIACTREVPPPEAYSYTPATYLSSLPLEWDSREDFYWSLGYKPGDQACFTGLNALGESVTLCTQVPK